MRQSFFRQSRRLSARDQSPTDPIQREDLKQETLASSRAVTQLVPKFDQLVPSGSTLAASRCSVGSSLLMRSANWTTTLCLPSAFAILEACEIDDEFLCIFGHLSPAERDPDSSPAAASARLELAVGLQPRALEVDCRKGCLSDDAPPQPARMQDRRDQAQRPRTASFPAVPRSLPDAHETSFAKIIA